MLGQFRRGTARRSTSELLPVAFLVSSSTGPSTWPFRSATRRSSTSFSTTLDDTLAALARRKQHDGWIDLDHDFYHVAAAEKPAATRDATPYTRAGEVAAVLRADRRRTVHRQQACPSSTTLPPASREEKAE